MRRLGRGEAGARRLVGVRRSSRARPVPSNERLDPRGDALPELPPLRYRVRSSVWNLLKGAGPRPRTCASLVALPRQDRLLLYGGCDAQQQHGGLHEYRLPPRRRSFTGGGSTERLAGGEWRQLDMAGPTPAARSNHCAVAHEGKLMLFGGFDGAGFLADLHAAVLEA